MKIFFALLDPCARNSPVTGDFPSQRPVTRSFDVFFDLRLIKQVSKQSRRGDLRHHRTHNDVTVMCNLLVIWFYKLVNCLSSNPIGDCNWRSSLTRWIFNNSLLPYRIIDELKEKIVFQVGFKAGYFRDIGQDLMAGTLLSISWAYIFQVYSFIYWSLIHLFICLIETDSWQQFCILV